MHVVDQADANVQGADVTVANHATGLSRSASTDRSGNASFADLPLTGSYDVRVKSASFAVVEQHGLMLDSDKIARAEFHLGVAAAQETVNVSSTDGTIQADSTELGVRFDAKELNETPVLGRKLSSAALLDSSVRPARGTGDLFLGQTLFAVDGAGRRQTTFAVDDVSGDDTWGRQTLFTAVPFSAVEEFAILRNPISAEYGRTSGNAINIVTKSGTNEWHGDVIGLWRPSQLEADAPLATRHTGDKLTQGSATISGPIIANRTHFLLSEEYNKVDRDALITSPFDSQALYTGHQRQELFLGRLDDQLSSQQQLSLRANLDRLNDSNPQDAVSALTLPSAGRTFKRGTYSLAASLTSSLSANMANDARLQFQLGSPITQFVPHDLSTQFVYPGVATFGESRYASLMNHQYEFADTLTHSMGDHTLKIGADAIYSSAGGFGQEFGGGFTLGQFTVKPSDATRSPSQLTISDVSRFSQSFGNQQYNIKEWLGAVFAQDNWRAAHDLTLELGLRYEAQTFTDDHNNVAPRVGLAYRLPRSMTVLRTSYGIFYSEERTDLAAADKLGGPQGVFTFSVAPGQVGFPTSLAPLPAFPRGAVLPARDITVRVGQAAYLNQFFPVSKLRFYPSALLNPYSQQWTAAIEHQLGAGLLLTVDYLGQRTLKIERPVDLNAPIPFVRTSPTQTRSAAAADATRPILPVANGYRRIVAFVNQGQAWYDGLHIELRKRLGRRFTGSASYTYSHTINTVETDAPSQDPNDSGLLGIYEKASSVLDQRHRISVSGQYHAPWKLEVGSWITAASGRPFNVTVGQDVNGDGSTSDRPVVNGVVIPRDFGRGTPTYDISAYVGRSFAILERARLQLRAEGFNLANANNIVGRNGIYGTGSTAPPAAFGTALSGISNVEPSRAFQFEARLIF